MTRAAATALAVLLVHQLVEGSRVDLGDALTPACLAIALACAGLGIVQAARDLPTRRLPPYIDSVLLALLVPLRGPLCDLGGLVVPAQAWPADGARLCVAALSLGPVSWLLGRRLAGLLHGGLTGVLAGVVAGEALAWAGGTGWLPAWLAGAATATALLVLAELSREREGPVEACSAVAPLLLGGALAVFVLALTRLVPAYVTPSGFEASDARVAVLLEAALVCWPASVLARGRRWGRALRALGAVLLAVALVRAVEGFAIYREPMAVVELTRELHVQAAPLHPWLTDWWVWLLRFAALGAAWLGLALAALPARAAGWLALGAGLAVAAESLVPLDPVRAPATWLLLGGGLAAAAAPAALFPRRGGWLVAIVVVPLLLSPVERRPGYDEVRRPGEFGIEGFRRTAPLDATLYSTPGAGSTALEGRRAQRTTFSCSAPALSLGPQGELVPPVDSGAACLGMRLGGVPWHPGHSPLGPDGSVGRLTRLFAVPGRALVAGPAAELFVADLHDAGLLESAIVASDVPLQELAFVVLASSGSGAWRAAEVVDPAAAVRDEAADCATILIAPGRRGWPGQSSLATESALARAARRLRPDGRCLLWLDAADLDAGALRARLAAFGAVFGERSAALVEPRGLDPPLLLLLGWRGDAGRPAAAELEARLASTGGAGARVPLRAVADLAALLVADGAGLAAAAEAGAVAGRSRPAPGCRWSPTGWSAVAAVVDPAARLVRAIDGAPDVARRSGEVFAGLAVHATYDYELADLNDTLLEIRRDVDWAAFDREVEHYVRAAQADRSDPLLHASLAALLEPLALSGDYGRFARVFEATGAREMRSVPLALLEAWVQQHSLEAESAQAALQRARDWAAGR